MAESSIESVEQLQQELLKHLKNRGFFASSAVESSDRTEELYQYGYHLYNHGKYAESSEFFQALTQLDPHDYDHWVGLGAAKQMQQLYQEALVAYTTASILKSTDPALYFHMANCCFALKYIEQGLKALDAAESLANNNQALISQLAILRQAWCNEEKTIQQEQSSI